MQKIIGARIKQLRDSISYVEFGKKLGLSPASLERWEKGRNNIKSDAVIQICLSCDVSADWLLGLSDRMKPLDLAYLKDKAHEQREIYLKDVCPECTKKDAVIAEMRATIVEAMKTSEPNNTSSPSKTQNQRRPKT